MKRDRVGDSIQTARNLTGTWTSYQHRNRVGRFDRNDIYRFTVNQSTEAEFNLSGIGRNARVGIQLFQLDEDLPRSLARQPFHRLTRKQLRQYLTPIASNIAGQAGRNWQQDLEPGEYIVRVFHRQGNSQYQLNLTAETVISPSYEPTPPLPGDPPTPPPIPPINSPTPLPIPLLIPSPPPPSDSSIPEPTPPPPIAATNKFRFSGQPTPGFVEFTIDFSKVDENENEDEGRFTGAISSADIPLAQTGELPTFYEVADLISFRNSDGTTEYRAELVSQNKISGSTPESYMYLSFTVNAAVGADPDSLNDLKAAFAIPDVVRSRSDISSSRLDLKTIEPGGRIFRTLTYSFDPPPSYILQPIDQNFELAEESIVDGIPISGLVGNEQNNHLTGNSQSNNLQGLAGNDTLEGGAGNDILNGGTEDDALAGSSGNDTLEGGAGSDTLEGGSGDDALEGGTGTNQLIGGSGDDEYTVDSLDDIIVELNSDPGIDRVTASISWVLGTGLENLSLLDNAISGTGNELNNDISGNSLSNILNGLAGNDQLLGSSGDDQLFGGDGNDQLTGSTGNDQLFGEDGDDTLSDDDGVNTIDGGAGTDTFYSSNNSVIVNLTTEIVTFPDDPDRTDTLLSIENVLLLNGTNDIVTGNAADNVLSSGAGDDQLYGKGGNDTLNGGSDSDILDGGAGEDTVTYENDDGSAVVDLSTGIATITDNFGTATDTLTSVENVIGGRGNDTITGDDKSNILNGYGVSIDDSNQIDTLIGKDGTDYFVLGGSWGVSYVESGVGHGLIQDWNYLRDYIQTSGTADQYELEFKAVGGVGSSAIDTEIYYSNGSTYDRIAIIQDSTNVSISRDFVFV